MIEIVLFKIRVIWGIYIRLVFRFYFVLIKLGFLAVGFFLSLMDS